MNSSVVAVLTILPAVLVLGLFVFTRWGKRPDRRGEPGMADLQVSPSVPEVNRSGWLFGLLPTVAVVGATASLLAMRWQTIPNRFPIHWGITGRPDGWAHRSYGIIFGPLVLTLAIVAGCGLMGELIARSSSASVGRTKTIRTTRNILVACSWFVTLLFCAISLLPLARNPTNLIPLLLVCTVAFSLGLVGYVAYRARRAEQTISSSDRSMEGRFWKAGFIYFNPEDAALVVPKRHGLGFTLNFGKPVCWLILALILLFPLILPLMLHASNNH
jgi:uncharacterized membrane protein